MPFGLSTDGLNIKRLSDIKSELEASFKAALGAALNVSPDSIMGQGIGIASERFSTQWELMQAVYDAFYPDSAEGVSLDNVSALVGVQRLPATFSTIEATLTGTPGTVVPAGSVASVEGTGKRFEALANITLVGGTGTGTFQAEDIGVVQAPAGTLTVIETPVSGWDTITNALDADVGLEIETDTELRFRRLQSLQIAGAATVEAIRARILQDVDQVSDVFVFENTSDIVDVNGLPPHSFESVVGGGDEQEIADKIWLVKAAGIATFGDITKIVADSQGFNHSIKFSRATEIKVWMLVQISVDTEFDVGTKQKEKITVTAEDNTTYDVVINGNTFTHVSGIGETDIQIAASLEAAINTGTYVPVTADDSAADGTFTLEADFAGNPFSLSVATSPTAGKLVISNVTLDSGDQGEIITDIVTFADSEQTIGSDVILSRYYTPVNDTQNILSIVVKADKDPVVAPPTGTTNIIIAPAEVAVFDSTRVIVEVV